VPFIFTPISLSTTVFTYGYTTTEPSLKRRREEMRREYFIGGPSAISKEESELHGS